MTKPSPSAHSSKSQSQKQKAAILLFKQNNYHNKPIPVSQRFSHPEDLDFSYMDEIFSQILHDSDPIQEIKNKYLNHQEFDYSEDLSTWMK